MPDTIDTIEVHTGDEVEVEHIKELSNGGARFDFSTEDRRWRVDVSKSGKTEIVTTWEYGQLADLDEPEWLGDVTVRLARA
ncbi:hypothetical protein [Haloarcula pellucida]|uniref:Uncharacterized protein n=1 Tax=Haloarcula pellucida TaxID=1427151 RepID=A0A830GFB6_9EURY|nr:hypothetical protein [Halomicroarcula pellucida]MBX0346598.1 hypothetical protein [Halomicroarcula pellucida]GGN84471.1 hypothetical protein GCM10009030_00160 [Halomicroarcula pellucida]